MNLHKQVREISGAERGEKDAIRCLKRLLDVQGFHA
jgi:hypothetical protein